MFFMISSPDGIRLQILHNEIPHLLHPRWDFYLTIYIFEYYTNNGLTSFTSIRMQRKKRWIRIP